MPHGPQGKACTRRCAFVAHNERATRPCGPWGIGPWSTKWANQWPMGDLSKRPLAALQMLAVGARLRLRFAPCERLFAEPRVPSRSANRP